AVGRRRSRLPLAPRLPARPMGTAPGPPLIAPWRNPRYLNVQPPSPDPKTHPLQQHTAPSTEVRPGPTPTTLTVVPPPSSPLLLPPTPTPGSTRGFRPPLSRLV
ncbi:unnamed protein product, partial [Ixodes persulcatus]